MWGWLLKKEKKPKYYVVGCNHKHSHRICTDQVRLIRNDDSRLRGEGRLTLLLVTIQNRKKTVAPDSAVFYRAFFLKKNRRNTNSNDSNTRTLTPINIHTHTLSLSASPED